MVRLWSHTTFLDLVVFLPFYPKVKNTKFLENRLTKLFYFAMPQIHFYLDEKIFDRVDVAVIGSSLGPALVILFLGSNEQN